MNRRMSRADKAGGKRSARKMPAQGVDPGFFAAFLEQGRLLLDAGNDEEATALAIRAVRLQETKESKELLVDCLKRWAYFPGAEEIRELLAKALYESWGSLGDLMGLAKGILERDAVIGAAIRRAAAAWPRRASLDELFGAAEPPRIADPLVIALLSGNKVSDFEIESFLTSVRAGLLDLAAREPQQDEKIVRFCCALAQQCYVTEYVYDLTPAETERAEALRADIAAALDTGKEIAPFALALLSAYVSLDRLPEKSLLRRRWPDCIGRLIDDQVRRPAAERALKASIRRITPIADETSMRVRDQYEVNPYPRWVNLVPASPLVIDEAFPRLFPFSGFRKIGKDGRLDVLIAGCGTGHHSIKFAQSFPQARILAVDLSLASLCYAKAKTRALGLDNIEYAQADILELGALGTKFDIISSSGVLHHLADPRKGWRTLLSLLSVDGCMHVGLYSELARRHLVVAQDWLRARSFGSSVEDIRRARQEMIAASATNPALGDVVRFADFFSTSECRDLLFHTQESRFALPEIQKFIDENGLNFLGFSIADAVLSRFRAKYSPQQMGDLNCWDAFEAEHPDTFKGMYEFWIQKKPALRS